jgi:ribosomal protein S18 acetylase RimI-like enzyme/O-methyltransferase involved in polyketide biosynthesis
MLHSSIMTLNQSSPVAKTAFDAIQAKLSTIAAGYVPMVVENQNVYEFYLRHVSTALCSKTTVRLQTPLVNAGYAARVLAVSSAVRTFVLYHQVALAARRVQHRRIRIVVLGCGIDVIGLWAHSLDPTLVSVVEFDTAEVCAIKKEILKSQNLVIEDNSGIFDSTDHVQDYKGVWSNNETVSVFSGTIVPVPDRYCCSGNNSISATVSSWTVPSAMNKYVLMSADLRDVSSLDLSMQQLSGMSRFRIEVPTLVISELVLAYLPPTSTEKLLSWCSSRLCQAPGSAFVAVEPLGFDEACEDEAATTLVSVSEGYRQDYCQQFRAKMEKGRSFKPIGTENESIPNQADGDNDSNTTTFHPIGSSLKSISHRLEKAGFARTSTTNLGIAAAIAASSTPSTTLVCPEIFDEYAALVLHLQSYALACGVTNAPAANNSRLCHNLFPWERPNASGIACALLPFVDTALGVMCSEIEPEDEGDVRRLFEQTYMTYMEDYPAIRKLVKGVLQNELRQTQQGVKFSHDQTDPRVVTQSSSSIIGNLYRSMGGMFLVAFRYDCGGEGDDELCNPDASTCRVAGCVGIRREEGKNVNTDIDHCLEIFRLAVDKSCRRMGIARSLLQAIERFARKRRSKKLVANTLSILDAACNLYESFGYTVEKETALGTTNLVIRTYVKFIE